MKIVIFKKYGIYYTTSEENYNAVIRNVREETAWVNFKSAQDIIDYSRFEGKKPSDFIIIHP